ncbi:MAG: flagellar hook-basal body complex protein [Magnetospirillum sp. WYHS-4]
MSMYGAFNASTLGMKAQSHALNVLGDNIANMRSGGHKRTDVNFSSLIGRTSAGGQAYGGVKPDDVMRISLSGLTQATDRDHDVSISGRGFFVLNTALDGSGETLYTRDGSFDVTVTGTTTTTAEDGSTITVPTGYLTDKNGYYVQGWAANADGTFTTTGATSAIRVDTYAFNNAGQGTTDASLNLNLDAVAPLGDEYTYDVDVYDSNGARRTLQFQFTKQNAVNTWEMDLVVPSATDHSLTPGTTNTTPLTSGAGAATEMVFDALNGTLTARAAGGGATVAGFFPAGQEYITISGSGDNDGIYRIGSVSADGSQLILDERTPLLGTSATDTADIDYTLATTTNTLTFDTYGALTSTSPLTYTVTWDDGATSDVSLDISEMTQFGGLYNPVSYIKNGYAAGDMVGFKFDATGHIVGSFEDDTHRALYRLPLAVFSNPDGLEAKNGMTFAETDASGFATVVLPGADGESVLNPGTVEFSNVDISEQFTRMIMTQTAYNASSRVFRTVDETTLTARDLVR